MDKLEPLRREYDRLLRLSDFRSEDRIWWIYLRNAVLIWLESNEDADLRTAVDRLKASAENLPNERQHWHNLRSAVARALARTGVEPLLLRCDPV